MQLYCIVCIVKLGMLVHASPAPLLGEKLVFQIVNKVYCYWEVSYVTDVFFENLVFRSKSLFEPVRDHTC
jgi:hypothetical protein